MSKILEKESKLSLINVLSNKQGRHVIWDILSSCGVYHDIAGSPDEVSRKLGRRSVGLQILDKISNIHGGDEILLTMSKEAKDREIMEEIENERKRKSDDDNYEYNYEYDYGSWDDRDNAPGF